jgi:hypothetical protein
MLQRTRCHCTFSWEEVKARGVENFSEAAEQMGGGPGCILPLLGCFVRVLPLSPVRHTLWEPGSFSLRTRPSPAPDTSAPGASVQVVEGPTVRSGLARRKGVEWKSPPREEVA